jgi:hypothetical protein
VESYFTPGAACPASADHRKTGMPFIKLSTELVVESLGLPKKSV